MTTSTSATINRAADLIEERGWGQGDWNVSRVNAPLCVEGGLAAAMGLVLEDERGSIIAQEYEAFMGCPAYVAVRDYLTVELLNGHRCLFSWNDRSDRTQAEVVAVLRAAALIEAAKESELAGVTP